MCSCSIVHTQKVGEFEKLSSRFLDFLDGLTAGIDSTKRVGAEMPLRCQPCFTCAVCVCAVT